MNKNKFHIFITIFGIIFFFINASLRADDAVFHGRGASIFPVESTKISLEREVVKFIQLPDSKFMVSAILWFYNETNEKISETLGFPIDKIEGEDSSSINDQNQIYINDFSAYVNGKKVNYSIIDGKKIDSELERSKIFLFKAKFEPKGYTSIFHTYSFQPILFSDGSESIEYVFSTGGKWKGSIKEAIFEINFSRPPIGFSVDYGGIIIAGFDDIHEPHVIRSPIETKTDFGFEYKFDYSGGLNPTFTITFYNIKPDCDLAFNYFGAGENIFIEEIPVNKNIKEKEEEDYFLFLCHGYLTDFYYSLKYKPELNENLLNCYEPQLLINFIYAYLGDDLKDKKFRNLFYESGMFMEASKHIEKSKIHPYLKEIINDLTEFQKKQVLKQNTDNKEQNNSKRNELEVADEITSFPEAKEQEINYDKNKFLKQRGCSHNIVL